MSASVIQVVAELTIAASIAILIVAAIRKPLRRIGGSRVAYLVWLLVPVSQLVVLLPTPPDSFGPTAQPVPQWMLDAIPAVTSSNQAAAGTSYATIGLIVWALGSLSMLSLVTLRQRAFIRSLGALSAAADGTHRSSAGRGPLLVGVWRPLVVLPTNFEKLYDAEEQALVLAHEQAHRDRRDQLVNVVATTWLCLSWFNPLMYWAIGLLRFDQDLTCDAVVLAGRSASRRRYASALLKTQLALESGWSLPITCSWQSSHPLTERIVMLKRPSPTLLRVRSAFLLTCASLLAGSYAVWMTLPRAAEAQVSPARDVSVVLNEAVTALNSGRTEEAKKAVATIDPTDLPAPARSIFESVSFNIALQEKRYDDARNHLEKAVSGLPAEQAARVRYQGTEALAKAEGR
jgi:bla regulator protein blaR1